MKSFTIVLFLMLLISLNLGESYKLTLICKNEKMSRPPFPCMQPKCDRFCAKMHYRGWGKCQEQNHYVCQCFHICYKDVPTKQDMSSSQPPTRI